jgi:hypothetical protein
LIFEELFISIYNVLAQILPEEVFLTSERDVPKKVQFSSDAISLSSWYIHAYIVL